MKQAKQKFIIIDGPTGAGKTTTADLLQLKCKKTAIVGLDRVKWLVANFRRTKRCNQMTADVILAMCKRYVQHGLSVILEQSFRDPSIIRPYLQLAKKKKLPIYVYELTAPSKILLERVKRRPKPKLAKKKLPIKRVKANINYYLNPKRKSLARLVLDSSKLSRKRIANIILQDLNRTL